jgi:DNA-binding MarR family transcriptional regulator
LRRKTGAAARKGNGRGTPDLGSIGLVWRVGGVDYLPLRLMLVAKLLDQNVGKLLQARFPITTAEWRVVAQLRVLQSASVRQMARQVSVDPAEVSRSVASLERRGFIVRRANPSDRRSPRFSLTRAGARHCARFHPHWRKFQRSLVGKLGASDRGVTEHALAVIARAALDLLEQSERPRSAGRSRRLTSRADRDRAAR